MKRMRRWEILLANLAWFLACLPGALAFLFAVTFPRMAQRRLLRGLLKHATETKYGRLHGFERMGNNTDAFQSHPVADYEVFRPFVDTIQSGDPNILTSDEVTLLQPTSGTSAARKLIPLTAGLLRQFQAALAPWIASLYVLRPRLLLGRQYWCLSPNTLLGGVGSSAVPVGFPDDTEYLGTWQRWFAARLLVAPPELARVEDPSTFEFLTLLFLVRERNLRLISVWHPSFLTLLLAALPRQVDRLASCLRTAALPSDLVLSDNIRDALTKKLAPDPQRVSELERCVSCSDNQFLWLWPHLQVISCWAGRDAESSLARLRVAFPGVTIQTKGLLATEGVVTIPWGFAGRHVAAVRSHFLEFIEVDTGQVKRVWELRPGGIYTVVLSTAGGFYRYHLKDRVRVTGFWAGTPTLEFLGRDRLVSDLCGEKLTGDDIESALEHFSKTTGVSFQFAMAGPDRSGKTPGYIFDFEADGNVSVPPLEACIQMLDKLLQSNFHYAHARRLGQLRPLQILPALNATLIYQEAMILRGQRYGEIKFPPLCKTTDLADVFRGN